MIRQIAHGTLQRIIEKANSSAEAANTFASHVEKYLNRMFDFKMTHAYGQGILIMTFSNVEGAGFSKSVPKAIEYAYNLTKGLENVEPKYSNKKAGTKQIYEVELK